MLTRFEYRAMLAVLMCLLALSTVRAEPMNEPATDEAVAETAMPIKTESGTVNGFFLLMVGEQPVDATFLPETLGEAHGIVLILHGADEGIDSKGVVHGLRSALPAAGWAVMTLALNYPQAAEIILAEARPAAEQEAAATEPQSGTEPTNNGAETASAPVVDNITRILTALADLHTRSQGPVILLGHGQGANEAIKVISEAAAEVDGLVVVAADSAPEQLSACPDTLAILDLIAGGEAGNMQSATMRKVAMIGQPTRHYSQRIVAGSDAAFHGFEQPLFSYVRGWLHRNFVQEANDQ